MGSNLAKKITVADNAASIYDYMGQQCPNSMFINPVNEDEVVNIIKSCKPKHSQDCDDINMYVLSKVTDQIGHLFIYSIFHSPRAYFLVK